jgi:carboxypeptidase Q
MRRTFARLALVLLPFGAVLAADTTPPAASPDEKMLRSIYTEALAHGEAFENLRTLVTTSPGRLAGSASLVRAVAWGEQTLTRLQLDRVFKQDVMVPHWERGEAESVILLGGAGAGQPLSATALGGSVATPTEGLTAEVIEVHSLDEVEKLGRDAVAGKIVFYNRPFDPSFVNPGPAYGAASDQRFRGPALAAKYGAVATLVRSMTHAHDDVPHTGATNFPAGQPPIPALALSTVAADRLAQAVATHAPARVRIVSHAHWLPDAPSNNVIGEIRGSTQPDQIIVVGGHLDSWDIAPGAHDDGAGIVQSIEVMRVFRALGLKPRHTLRCVLFVNEENGTRGAAAYAAAAKSATEKHIFAIETDNGGFQPRGFSLNGAQPDIADRAARWLPLFRPYGIYDIHTGNAGTDVEPLLALGATVGELNPDSQRYFDIHHTREDSLDKVNPR